MSNMRVHCNAMFLIYDTIIDRWSFFGCVGVQQHHSIDFASEMIFDLMPWFRTDIIEGKVF
ncbi:hypothetical protein OSB98_03200 [Providencia stuartii]|uniref:hypothetical protein n=1 Tax=Providencia stuartii TaxID=588 RepID=UPI00069F78CC|nr:hypothetical protein [Providencia stuartii]KSX94868.1 hypothetical protein APT95_01980 [Providencia stuartii]MDT2013643.1 hypothetical protein [Providencia stuartii]MDX7492920.1 hypothetical protein [Providencia stuartii]HEM6901146.1 hypothetical protein [Providencia stuartii]HEM6904089.1 hypothetical protein [Providencia stuartii]